MWKPKMNKSIPRKKNKFKTITKSHIFKINLVQLILEINKKMKILPRMITAK